MQHPPDPQPPAGLHPWVQALADAALSTQERRVLVLSGSHCWGMACAAEALATARFKPLVWIGSGAPAGLRGLDPGQARGLLGGEIASAVIDAYSGFDPDALGAVSGAIRGGGLLVLLTPPLGIWADYPDPQHTRIAVHPFRPGEVSGRFLRRIAGTLQGTAGILLVEEGQPLPSLGTVRVIPPRTTPTDPDCLTEDQAQAVSAILRVAWGQGRQPLVITSDRGRGKSAALGIAAARLLARSPTRIVRVTGPSAAATAILLQHVQRLLPGGECSGMGIKQAPGRIGHTAPDALVRDHPSADLLLVDEAATLPAALLERLLRAYPRVVFATTQQGYEGTGRGFAVRFRGVLDRLTPEWQGLHLTTPIRWSPGDPLEAWTYRALLLDASPASDRDLVGAAADTLRYRRLERDALAADEAALGELFGLLVLAHYRTSPTDLRHLLDGPNLSVYAAEAECHLAATALVADEGGFDEGLARAVLAGRRRPRGHLIPQSLAAHLGLTEGPQLRCARIVRIAVHPALWRRGIGGRLLAHISEQARARGADLLGASFGASDELLRFWKAVGCLPVRFGMTRDKASGLHSALVLRPLSEAGEKLVARARARFLEHLPHQLGDPLRDLEPEIAGALMAGSSSARVADLSVEDWLEIAACGFAHRGLEDSLLPIWRLACLALANGRDPTVMTEGDRRLLILRVIQRWSWRESAQALGLTGSGAARGALQGALRRLFLGYAPASARAEAARLGLIEGSG